MFEVIDINYTRASLFGKFSYQDYDDRINRSFANNPASRETVAEIIHFVTLYGGHMIKLITGFVLLIMVAVATPVSADVVSSSDDYYILGHQASRDLNAIELWQRLVKPSAWWHPDHTYSGDSKNLPLDLQAEGIWLEKWDENSVFHELVLTVIDGKMIRLNAPFALKRREMAVSLYLMKSPTAQPQASSMNWQRRLIM